MKNLWICIVLAMTISASLFCDVRYEVTYADSAVLSHPYLYVQKSESESLLRYWNLSIENDSIRVSCFELDTSGNLSAPETVYHEENIYGFTLDTGLWRIEEMGTKLVVTLKQNGVIGALQFVEGNLQQMTVFDTSNENPTTLRDGMSALWNENTLLVVSSTNVLLRCNLETGAMEPVFTFSQWAEISILPLGQEYLLVSETGLHWQLFGANLDHVQEITNDDIPNINGTKFSLGTPAFPVGGGYIISVHDILICDRTDFVWIEDNYIHYSDAFPDAPNVYNYRNLFTSLDEDTFFYVQRLWNEPCQVVGSSIVDHELEPFAYVVEDGITLTDSEYGPISFASNAGSNRIHIYDREISEEFVFECEEIPLEALPYPWIAHALGNTLMLEHITLDRRIYYRYHIDRILATDDQIHAPELQTLDCYPNPFNPHTTVRFTMASDGEAEISVFNLRGQKVRTLVDRFFTKGGHHIEWNGCDEAGKSCGSGVYLIRMKSGYNTRTSKALMIK